MPVEMCRSCEPGGTMRAELGLWEDRNVPLVASHLGYGTILLVLDVLSHEGEG